MSESSEPRPDPQRPRRAPRPDLHGSGHRRDLRAPHPLGADPVSGQPDEQGGWRYVPERGYSIGPTLPTGEPPWPLMWEQRDNDTCAHQWEVVTLPARDQWTETERCVRCSLCHTPRCGHSEERDPCMERRHHQGLHMYLSGEFEPLGGILRCHVEGCRHTAAMCPDHRLSA
jgi:hypothetical protein